MDSNAGFDWDSFTDKVVGVGTYILTTQNEKDLQRLRIREEVAAKEKVEAEKRAATIDEGRSVGFNGGTLSINQLFIVSGLFLVFLTIIRGLFRK